MKKLIDRNGRRINYLRLSVTPRCNFRCIYCSKKTEGLRTRFLTPHEIEKIVSILQKIDKLKIRLTGGEPLLREDIVEIVERLSRYSSVDVFLTTNGSLLKKYAKPLREAGLKRLNVSLDSLKPDVFKKITNSESFGDVLDGIYAAKDAGFYPIKINVVLLRGINDSEIFEFINFSERTGVIIRFIEVMPLGIDNWRRYFISNDEIIKKIDHIIDRSSGSIMDGPARYFKLKNGVELGFISPISHNFCDTCSRIRISYDGYLITCLVSGKEYDLLGLLRNGGDEAEIIRFIRKVIDEKPVSGDYGERLINRTMVEIGG